MNRTVLTATASLIFILAGLPGHTLAQVWINGQLVQGAELEQLQAVYGEPIPAGRYWLGGNGDWGHEGNYRVLGNLYTDNRSAPSGNSGSGGGWVDNHGSSGSIMKDEDGCMYFSGGGVSGSTC